MTFYADTSVLISSLAEDRHTPRARAWLSTAPRLLISTWTLAELSSVLAIKRRQGILTTAEVESAERQIEVMTSDPLALENVAPDDMIRARGLVRLSANLRAPDALHLAISLRLGLPMATFDDNLRQACIAARCSVADL